MASVGMIHLACYCGAELFYLGEKPKGVTNGEILDILQERFGPGDVGVLTPAEDLHGECPYCGLIYELPDPRLLKQLPFVEQSQFRSALSQFQQRIPGNGDTGFESNSLGRYVS